MANTILTSSMIARAALATLYENTVMLPLVHRDYEPDFQKGRGATVTVRKPLTFTAESYNGSTITVQNGTETSVPVVLDQHDDVSFRVTSTDMTLKITDFAEQFLKPAMEAINQKVDRAILAGVRTGVTATVGDGVTSEPWSDPKVLVDAGLALDKKNVPLLDRYAVVDPTIKAYWIKDALFHEADKSGDTAGLRRATLGSEKFGFEPYMTQNITDSIGVGFHKTACAFVSRPLELPRGAADASIVNYKGMGIRVVIDWDMQLKADVCSLDVLYGVKLLDANRAVLIDASGSGS